ncbi:23S rRNA (adenine(2030)-N(6))-methyltransferase RlmJ [Microbulbifer aestuariivivens]|uniref:23S rRNA (adenine(2030)-N(6))-methyltransferase RlmJ n=1 Tax=Microbulbifer aestuariivivens TaxID=1908308 RepID=UPI003CD07468
MHPLSFHPGSPPIAGYSLRLQDRIGLLELQPEDYQLPQKSFKMTKCYSDPNYSRGPVYRPILGGSLQVPGSAR